MRWVAAFVALSSGLVLAGVGRRPALVDRIGVYLRPKRVDKPAAEPSSTELLRAGLAWTLNELMVRRIWAVAVGAAIGALLAQGDLFLSGEGRSLPALLLIGGASGLLAFNVWLTTRRERRSARLAQELPTVADAIALGVLAGEPVAGAIERYTRDANGVAAEELHHCLEAYRSGHGLPEILQAMSKRTAHADAGRLYSLLANAHQAGGRLADALAGLAADYRAGLERELVAEGGRRALSTYGPILALMIPVTLLFLMYPTLAGLRELSAGP